MLFSRQIALATVAFGTVLPLVACGPTEKTVRPPVADTRLSFDYDVDDAYLIGLGPEPDATTWAGVGEMEAGVLWVLSQVREDTVRVHLAAVGSPPGETVESIESIESIEIELDDALPQSLVGAVDANGDLLVLAVERKPLPHPMKYAHPRPPRADLVAMRLSSDPLRGRRPAAVTEIDGGLGWESSVESPREAPIPNGDLDATLQIRDDDLSELALEARGDVQRAGGPGTGRRSRWWYGSAREAPSERILTDATTESELWVFGPQRALVPTTGCGGHGPEGTPIVDTLAWRGEQPHGHAAIWTRPGVLREDGAMRTLEPLAGRWQMRRDCASDGAVSWVARRGHADVPWSLRQVWQLAVHTDEGADASPRAPTWRETEETAAVAELVRAPEGWIVAASGGDRRTVRFRALDSALQHTTARHEVVLEHGLDLLAPRTTPSCVARTDAIVCLVRRAMTPGARHVALLVVPRRTSADDLPGGGRGRDRARARAGLAASDVATTAAADVASAIAANYAHPLDNLVDRSATGHECATPETRSLHVAIETYCAQCTSGPRARCPRARRLFCENRDGHHRAFACRVAEQASVSTTLFEGPADAWVSSKRVGARIRRTGRSAFGTPIWEVVETDVIALDRASPTWDRMREALRVAATRDEFDASRLSELAQASKNAVWSCGEGDGVGVFSCLRPNFDAVPAKAIVAREPFTLTFGDVAADTDGSTDEDGAAEEQAMAEVDFVPDDDAAWRVADVRTRTMPCGSKGYDALADAWHRACAPVRAMDSNAVSSQDISLARACATLPSTCPLGAELPRITSSTRQMTLPIRVDAEPGVCGVRGNLTIRRISGTWEAEPNLHIHCG